MISFMNPKIFVGIAVVIVAAVIGLVGFSGQSIFDDVSDKGIFSTNREPAEVLPIGIELKSITISEVDERAATIEIKLQATNPNYKSVILSYVKYQLFENEQRVHVGQIGEQLEGMVVGSNYFTLLSDTPTVLTDKITIKNSGNVPEFWTALSTDSANWRLSGEAFYYLSSMTSGGQKELSFEFTQN